MATAGTPHGCADATPLRQPLQSTRFPGRTREGGCRALPTLAVLLLSAGCPAGQWRALTLPVWLRSAVPSLSGSSGTQVFLVRQTLPAARREEAQVWLLRQKPSNLTLLLSSLHDYT